MQVDRVLDQKSSKKNARHGDMDSEASLGKEPTVVVKAI